MISREKDSHKGENGKVAVIGGSIDYTGAPALSAQAALRTGSDLVRVLTSIEVRDVVAGYSENLIVEGYDSEYFGEESMEAAKRLADWADVTVLGPGLGSPKKDVISQFLENTETALVVDADALQAAVDSEVSNAVLTPHSGEAEKIRKKFGTLEEFVETREDVVVLEKGSTDKIWSEDGTKEVPAGHPGMSVGGSGDVLTGVVAGLISQGMAKKEAAVEAARINGDSGEKAAEKYGNGLLATDLLERIPMVLSEK